jgi:hypothetical protein
MLPLPHDKHPAEPHSADLPKLPAYLGNYSGYEPEGLLQSRTERIRHGSGRLLRTIIAGLICLAVIILIFMLTHRPEDEKAQATAETFIVAMQSDDAGKAYDMGNDAFRSATTEENLNQLFDQVKPFVNKARIDKVDSYYATSSKGDPRAIIVYTASKDTHVTYIRLVMDKQGDAWKVHSLITKAQPLLAKPE